MSLIQNIRQPISSEMQAFNDRFKMEFVSENKILTTINSYILQTTGKQLRPILTILSAKICGEINQSTIDGAIALELLHTASLIHDDVVDNSLKRRGHLSVNAHWSNKYAILTGDYLFSKSLKCATNTKNLKILELISNIVMTLCDGELLQLSNQQHTNITEKDYFDIIHKKTAILFSSCTELGGLSVHAKKSQLKHLRSFGEFLGICFQIKDDIFDFSDSILVGKPTGIDIMEGKLTLPLIYVLENSKNPTKNKIIKWIQCEEFSAKNIHFISRFVHEEGGITYAEKQMEIYKNKALEELSDFKDGEIKDSLMACVKYATVRDH